MPISRLRQSFFVVLYPLISRMKLKFLQITMASWLLHYLTSQHTRGVWDNNPLSPVLPVLARARARIHSPTPAYSKRLRRVRSRHR
ncbi:hypothetical protein F5B20DRAFT_558432 [Whalleya microplaca]|nr:hypothetical protein F5B20DRAFT_558432 [Whalleya microplaca]